MNQFERKTQLSKISRLYVMSGELRVITGCQVYADRIFNIASEMKEEFLKSIDGAQATLVIENRKLREMLEKTQDTTNKAEKQPEKESEK